MSRRALDQIATLHDPAGDVCAACGDPYPCATLLIAGAALAEEEASPLESRVEYGHQTTEMGWVPEWRGIKYATQQRTVYYRTDEPVLIDHWTYADHRHPMVGCTHDRHDLTALAAPLLRL